MIPEITTDVFSDTSPQGIFNTMIVFILVYTLQEIKTTWPGVAKYTFFLGLLLSPALMFLASLAFGWDMNVFAIILYGLFAAVFSSATYNKSNGS